MRRSILALLAMTLLATGCLRQEARMTEWDLRETRSVDAVGWPDGAGSMFEDREVERILLPGDIVVEGMHPVRVSRDGGMGEPYEDVIRILDLSYRHQSVQDALERARELAALFDLDLRDIPTWAARNDAGPYYQTPGGLSASSGQARLADGAVVSLSATVFTEGRATVRVTNYWERDDAS